MTTANPDTPAPAQPGEVRVPVLLRTSVKKPMATYIILAVTIVIYGLQFFSQQLLNGVDYPSLLGAKINEYILKGEVWRLITPVLLHGGILHLAFNMYALYTIGPSLERFYGHRRYLALYLIGAFTGNVLSFLLSSGASLGASTAIFGLVAAETVFIFKNKKMFGSKARSMLINLGLVIVVNLSFGLTPNSGIDNWGHLGGLIGGLIFAWLAGPIFKVQQNPEGRYELIDSRNKRDLFLGILFSAGLFAIAAIVRFLIK
jgi:rhomboid protease GluP